MAARHCSKQPKISKFFKRTAIDKDLFLEETEAEKVRRRSTEGGRGEDTSEQQYLEMSVELPDRLDTTEHGEQSISSLEARVLPGISLNDDLPGDSNVLQCAKPYDIGLVFNRIRNLSDTARYEVITNLQTFHRTSVN